MWGLFKKIVIADNCAEYANTIFNNSADYSGSTLVIGALFFAFQIYCDFSGYSDIALGTARLFGIDLLRNFAFPYFSRDIAEFWRRWHISLSSWFKDYLYIPLGGSKGGMWMKVRNTFIIFIVSGFWHGANWTFIIWGVLNAIYFLPLLLTNNNRNNLETVAQGKLFPSLKELLLMLLTFGLTVFAWIFFRAENINHALFIIGKIFSKSIMSLETSWTNGYITILHIFLVLLFLVVEWLNRDYEFGLQRISNYAFYRKIAYFLLICCILFTADYHSKQEFIYFQF